jgi:hypothetical protein
MSFSLSEHQIGCTPLQPCFHCVVASFLRKELSPAKFGELLKLTENKSHVPFDTLLGGLHTGFSVRTKNCLKNDNILTLGDLVRKTERELHWIPNLGDVSVSEIKVFLDSIGHFLGELPPHSDN